MYNAKKSRNIRVPGSSKPKQQQQQQQRSRILTPIVPTAQPPYQQALNYGGYLPEVRTTATSPYHTHRNYVIGQYSAAGIPKSTESGAETNFLANSKPPSPLVPTPVSTASGAAAVASGIGSDNFGYRRGLNNPTNKTITQRSSSSSSASATAGSADTNPVRLANKNFFLVPAYKDLSFLQAECDLAHAQVAGGCVQNKKQQQQQYNNSIQKRDDDSKNNNSNNNFNSKSSVSTSVLTPTNRSEQKPSSINNGTNATITNISNSSKSLHGNNSLSARSVGREVTAETLNVMRRVTPGGNHQKTVGTTIAAAAPATGKNNENYLLSPSTITTTSTVNTKTTANATLRRAAATGSSSTKGGAGYLRLQHVQNTRVLYHNASNKTGLGSSRHLQNTTNQSFSAFTTIASGVLRTAGGSIPTAIITGTGKSKNFHYNNTNNNIVDTNCTTITAKAPRLVATSNNRNNNSGNNASMGSNNYYMNYRHLHGNNSNDNSKQQQQKQQSRERDPDQHDDITFIDSDEITPTKTMNPDITVESVNAQTMKPSLNDKSPIFFKPITPPFQQRSFSHTERGTHRARPRSTILLPTTSRSSSATTYGDGGVAAAGSSYTFERVNNYKYTNGALYVDSKVGVDSSKNISGSGVITTASNAGQSKTTAAYNIDKLGIKNSIEKFNSLSSQKNQRSSVVSNNFTISTNKITTAPAKDTAAFTAHNVSGSNAVENTASGSSTNLQQRYNTDVENQSTSINSRVGAGYSHSLTRGTHRNNSGGNSSNYGNIGGRGGFGAGASATHNSRTSTIASASSPMVVTNKITVAGIRHSARPAAAATTTTTTTSSVLASTGPRSRFGFANNSNSRSNTSGNDRSTIKALNSLENIASGIAKATTKTSVTTTTSTVCSRSIKSVKNSSCFTTNNKLTTLEHHQQQHKQQQQYNNDSVIIKYNSSGNSNKISTGAGDNSQIPTSSSSSSTSSNNISSNVDGASSYVVTPIASASTTPTPLPEASKANAAAISSISSNNSKSSSGTAVVVTSTQVAVIIANESVRNAAGATRTILPPVSPTTAAIQRYWERENSSGIRNSHALPTSTVTSSSLGTSKYSSTINDTNKLSNGRDAANKGLCGLRNIGNTCFMNSVIQCLSHTTELTRFLKAHHGSRSAATKDQQILHEFAKLIQEMWTADVHSVTPMELKRAFSTKHRMYSDFNQQDAQEFLRFFLDSLHSALNTGVKNEPLNIDDNLSDNKKAELTWEWYIRHENSLIRELFVGQLKSTLKCTTCGNTSVTFDPFWDLSVSLPSSSRCKLEACLDLFIREEVLDGDETPTCSKCKTRRKCTKSFTIQRFPKYLVIHLKRFSETRWSKLSNIVEFPTGDRELNMGPYAANTSSSVQYSLYAVSNHMGSTDGGHYVALCKHPVSRKWHEFNDNIVSDAISEPGHLVSSCAYILFYERA